jgi:4-amino-4-deoxy-L-arabinose transferase-like glycosyltransferase
MPLRLFEAYGGFSLDGVHPTTGAPFLWIYLTSLNHLLFGQDAAIRATLMESALFGALAAIVIFYLARKLLHDRRIAWTAFLLCTFTANAFFNAMNGMDTAFFTLFVLLAIAAFFQVGKPAKWSPFAWGCVTGLMAGITVMTRGDGLFVIFALFCVGAYQWWVAPKQERKNRMHALLGMLLIAGLCFAFFMGWQLVQTGSPLHQYNAAPSRPIVTPTCSFVISANPTHTQNQRCRLATTASAAARKKVTDNVTEWKSKRFAPCSGG